MADLGLFVELCILLCAWTKYGGSLQMKNTTENLYVTCRLVREAADLWCIHSRTRRSRTAATTCHAGSQWPHCSLDMCTLHGEESFYVSRQSLIAQLVISNNTLIFIHITTKVGRVRNYFMRCLHAFTLHRWHTLWTIENNDGISHWISVAWCLESKNDVTYRIRNMIWANFATKSDHTKPVDYDYTDAC